MLSLLHVCNVELVVVEQFTLKHCRRCRLCICSLCITWIPKSGLLFKMRGTHTSKCANYVHTARFSRKYTSHLRHAILTSIKCEHLNNILNIQLMFYNSKSSFLLMLLACFFVRKKRGNQLFHSGMRVYILGLTIYQPQLIIISEQFSFMRKYFISYVLLTYFAHEIGPVVSHHYFDSLPI